jgi:hypothetical protein
MAVFWVVAPCSLVEIYRSFRGACCLHHQGYDRSDDGDLWTWVRTPDLPNTKRLPLNRDVWYMPQQIPRDICLRQVNFFIIPAHKSQISTRFLVVKHPVWWTEIPGSSPSHRFTYSRSCIPSTSLSLSLLSQASDEFSSSIRQNT